MKKFNLVKSFCFLMAVVMMFIVVPKDGKAEGEEPKLPTVVFLNEAVPEVEYDQDSYFFEAEIFDALDVEVFTGERMPVDFDMSEIQMKYKKAVGEQTVTIKYTGDDLFLPSEATAKVKVVEEDKKKDTSIQMTANGVNIPFNDDSNFLNNAVYEALNIKVIDSAGKSVNFDKSEIALTYNHAVGNQKVTVTYKGTNTYTSCTAITTINLTDKMASQVKMKEGTPSVDHTTDAAELDRRVYAALGIGVTDAKGNNIAFDPSEIKISYNRAIGAQDVTIRYSGNLQFTGSSKTGNMKIVGEAPKETSTKSVALKDTKIVLAEKPESVKFNQDAKTLNDAVYAALKIQVLDSNDKKVDFTPNDIEISYNHASGDQAVTVVYKGNNENKRSEATKNVKITDEKTVRLVLVANPPQIPFDSNTEKLTEAVYKGLGIELYDEANQKINFKKEEITLEFKPSLGTQKVDVKYKGNDQYKSTAASTNIAIVEEKAPEKSNTTFIIIGIIAVIVIVGGIVGGIMYKKNRGNK